MKLRLAAEIAFEAHEGQLDLAGKPYFGHLMRVAAQMDTEEEMALALLHDLIEDTEWTFKEIRPFLTEYELEALDALTHVPNEPWVQYVGRIKRNRLAIKVKLADLKDNMDRSRIPAPTKRDFERWMKYEVAKAELLGEVGISRL